MNSNIEPHQDPPPPSPSLSPDDVADQLSDIDLTSNNNPSIQEDVVMTEAVGAKPSSIDTKISPEERISELEKRKVNMYNIWKVLDDKSSELMLMDDDHLLEANQKRLSYIEGNIQRLTNLIEAERKLVNLTVPFISHNVNNKYIPSDQLPKFNVDATASALYQLTHRDGNKNDKNSTNEPSLERFLREFERKFRDHGVSIDENWLPNLEICFEKSDNNLDHDWFARYVKRPVVELKEKRSWVEVKDLLIQKFDLASQTSQLSWTKYLVNFKQGATESLMASIHRFRLFATGAKFSSSVSNPILNTLFLSRLFTAKYQETILATVEKYNKSSLSSVTNTTKESIYAPSNAPMPLDMSWDDFEAILVKNIAHLESALIYIQKEHQQEVSKRQTESANDHQTKKRNFITANDQPTRYNNNISRSNVSNYNNNNNNRSMNNISRSNSKNDFFQEIADLKKKGLCTYCKTAKYSVDHAKICSARIKYEERKKTMNNHKPSVSIKPDNIKIKNDKNDKAIAGLEVTLQSNLASQNLKVVKSDISNSLSFNSSQDKIKASNKDYDSSSEDEYELFFNEYDRDLISSNKDNNLDLEYNNDINVFALRNHTVGDIDNPFDSDCVSFSPVTPITLNNNNTYGIIDTGANVSVINKNFANANNIEFNSIPGHLVLANGNKIPRMQTTHFVNVEYDNVDSVIKHKFDVIDDTILSYDNKILIGIDLLPKLSIHLMNVAVKHKSTEKEKDGSIVDKAYEPNISRAGTDKEQKVFDLAIKPYIVANQQLNKNSLCNIPDAVLYLPTPPNYVANIKQYPIPYTLQPKVMEIINNWIEDGIIVPAKPSAWNLPMTVTVKKNLDGTKTDKIRLVLHNRMLDKVLPIDNHLLSSN
ncbi:hypothetical protein G6F36_011112 [Rhizopus arrhizus]|nr:hypothetical protein G6F36_011112 [Rhizopus arrhizus]